MKNEKQKKVTFIVIIAIIVLIIATVIGITVFVLKIAYKDNNKSAGKDNVSSVDKITEEITTEEKITESDTENVTTKEDATTEKSTTEEPTTEEVTTEEPITEEVTTEEPTTQESTTEVPTTQEPTTERPTQPPVQEEPMRFSVEDGVLYQYNSKKKEVVETGLSSSYELSPNAKAIYYRLNEGDKLFVWVVGKERVEITLEDAYFHIYNFCDTGEAYILGEPTYEEAYWCKTPIYYFDGSSIQVLTDRAPEGEMSYMPTVYYAENAPVIMFKQLKNTDSAEVEGFFIAVKDKIYYWGNKGGFYEFNDTGDRLWYVSANELYEVRIAYNQLGPTRLIDENVSSIDLGFDPSGGNYDCYVNIGNDVVYFKNLVYLVEGEGMNVKPIQSGDMYIDGHLIDTDVVPNNVWCASDKIYYFTDWNVECERGTLTTYYNGVVKGIASNVHSFTVDVEKIYYITAWDGESGALVECYNGIEKTIATKVTSVYKLNGVVKYHCLNGEYIEIDS